MRISQWKLFFQCQQSLRSYKAELKGNCTVHYLIITDNIYNSGPAKYGSKTPNNIVHRVHFFDGNAITQFLYMRNYSDCHTTKNGIITALKCGFWLQLTFYRGIFIVKFINYSILRYINQYQQ